MAFEQISLAQYNKAISILDNRIATLEKAYTALAELKKIRREFIDLYNQGDHVAIDYSEWQEDLNSVSTKVNTVKDEIVAAEEDSDGDGRGNDKIFKSDLATNTIKRA